MITDNLRLIADIRDEITGRSPSRSGDIYRNAADCSEDLSGALKKLLYAADRSDIGESDFGQQAVSESRGALSRWGLEA